MQAKRGRLSVNKTADELSAEIKEYTLRKKEAVEKAEAIRWERQQQQREREANKVSGQRPPATHHAMNQRPPDSGQDVEPVQAEFAADVERRNRPEAAERRANTKAHNHIEVRTDESWNHWSTLQQAEDGRTPERPTTQESRRMEEEELKRMEEELREFKRVRQLQTQNRLHAQGEQLHPNQGLGGGYLGAVVEAEDGYGYKENPLPSLSHGSRRDSSREGSARRNRNDSGRQVPFDDEEVQRQMAVIQSNLQKEKWLLNGKPSQRVEEDAPAMSFEDMLRNTEVQTKGASLIKAPNARRKEKPEWVHVTEHAPTNDNTRGRTGSQDDGGEGYIERARFEGSMPGYVFKMGPRGVGYYPDPTRQQQPSPARRRRDSDAPSSYSGTAPSSAASSQAGGGQGRSRFTETSQSPRWDFATDLTPPDDGHMGDVKEGQHVTAKKGRRAHEPNTMPRAAESDNSAYLGKENQKSGLGDAGITDRLALLRSARGARTRPITSSSAKQQQSGNTQDPMMGGASHVSDAHDMNPGQKSCPACGKSFSKDVFDKVITRRIAQFGCCSGVLANQSSEPYSQQVSYYDDSNSDDKYSSAPHSAASNVQAKDVFAAPKRQQSDVNSAKGSSQAGKTQDRATADRMRDLYGMQDSSTTHGKSSHIYRNNEDNKRPSYRDDDDHGESNGYHEDHSSHQQQAQRSHTTGRSAGPLPAQSKPADRDSMPLAHAQPLVQDERVAPEDLELHDCPSCGRRFNSQALQKHAKVCQKVFQQKRKTFDITKARNEGTDNAKFVKESKYNEKKSNTKGKQKASYGFDSTPVGGGGAKADWKAKSEQFRAAMRAARQITEAQAKGIDIRTLHIDSGPEAPDDRVLCPHCGRKFAALTAERHIPSCKNTVNKPRAVGAPASGAARSAMGSKSGRAGRW